MARYWLTVGCAAFQWSLSSKFQKCGLLVLFDASALMPYLVSLALQAPDSEQPISIAQESEEAGISEEAKMYRLLCYAALGVAIFVAVLGSAMCIMNGTLVGALGNVVFGCTGFTIMKMTTYDFPTLLKGAKR